ncbi:anthranilate synthase component 2 [Natrialba magadii ATCC 43099]|uniref:anthranilate synthase n=1 Tax=Natrialba magadii (strain ATCC 43099 / DSM 3394 / CCM 3739 / CIP 104546 / IAM 13178 / JCM 8861 / NBRC 102185 / NCIMB 2190 / MS3) TaxID=547559 RepID=D3SVU1_NATMM|nr:anthranilate synthase component II [Natrialba magadii]ADD03660.1 anthranilate synthase component 2 [Natrialba magadii ATCC 43099]ELY34426.1 glutamine amidotransferase [Natrialba magadii ATCC 43099]
MSEQRVAQETRTQRGDGESKRVLFIDNYDSFTYNLVEYVSQQDDTETEVLKNTATLEAVRAVDPDAIIISPGPGHPKNDRDVGVSMDVLRECSPEIPTLGVCLGLEAAVYEYGGSVGRAPDPIHGKASSVDHDGTGVFAGLEQGFQAGRYHSLVATEVPDCFEVTATAIHSGSDGGDDHNSDRDDSNTHTHELVMGIRHREYPLECVQFHPESVLTAAGHDIIENFLEQV